MSETALKKSYDFNKNEEESLGTCYDYCKNFYMHLHESLRMNTIVSRIQKTFQETFKALYPQACTNCEGRCGSLTRMTHVWHIRTG